ncbi:MAG: CBS domain-containing protein [Cyanobacteria bacterium CRU_2_1]|nr:CBS domain-containing protein [Cyanobacteria bacterium RU_5_0]NJR58736.1 CBS domain-containing protein [Cyanobacteria bacterium CRU_2_1]
MDLILCHTTADFDTLGAAVGLARLRPGARIVLTGGCHPTVRDFLALHRDEYALIERRSVNPKQIRTIAVVDTQWRDRLGKAAEWLDRPGVEITVYDHHLDSESDIPATSKQIEPVGAITTLIAEQLQQLNCQPSAIHLDEKKSLPLPIPPSSHPPILTPAEATVMALGIHVDTGSLTFDHTTVRDAAALTWLMTQGASLRAIAEYVEPGLSPQMQDLLTIALEDLHMETIQGFTLTWVLLSVETYIPGLSNLASRLLSLTETDVLLLAARYNVSAGDERLTVIGRSRSSAGAVSTEGIDLAHLFRPLGGGGHPKAAALTLRSDDPNAVLMQLVEQLRSQLPHPPVARELMSSPVRTIRPETTIAEAQRILLRYGHSGLSVVDADDQLVGIISRRDLDIALHHGFSHAPVKGYMTTNLKTIAPDTPLPEIESLMVTYDIGRLPVLENSDLVGIVTRTDVLRQLHREKAIGWEQGNKRGGEQKTKDKGQRTLRNSCLLPEVVQGLLRDRLTLPLWEVLMIAAEQAEQRGWQLYVVGGAVRDLLLADPDDVRVNGNSPLPIDDIDLVVDGFHRAADQAAGVELAKALRKTYPNARLQVHGRFQTAALLWHNDPALDSLWVDIATARTEFYPYPAANPEVEASSIRQDLYRRDFTINAMAIRLTAPRTGEILDFFGGLLDLEAKQIRVLHANSFIEDPTRIYRAVRFAVRLNFQIDPQTEGYIRHAIASGVYHRIQAEMDKAPALQTRLRQELKYILQAPYWKSAIRLLADLGAMCCIHSNLVLTDQLWWQLRLVDRWLKRFDPQSNLDHWLTLLEVMLSGLEGTNRIKVAENLKLPADSIQRLHNLSEIKTHVTEVLPNCQRPSQVFQHLSQYDLSTLTLLAVIVPRSIRKQIWHYLTHWATIKSPLDGNDLRKLGYQPGRHYKPILDALLAATLDGEIGDRSDAELFLKTHFPLK